MPALGTMTNFCAITSLLQIFSDSFTALPGILGLPLAAPIGITGAGPAAWLRVSAHRGHPDRRIVVTRIG